MSHGRSFRDQRGKVYLSEPMVAYMYKGRLILRRHPKSIRWHKTEIAVRQTNHFAVISRAWTTLSEKEQAVWEMYASMLYSSRLREKQDVSGSRCGGIIRRRAIPATGKGAFIQANMLLYTVGLPEIRRRPPFNTGFPPPPSSVSLEYAGGVARVIYDNPIVVVNGVKPTVGKVRIWSSYASGTKRSYSHIVGVADIEDELRVKSCELGEEVASQTPSAFTFDSVRIGNSDRIDDMKLGDFKSGMLYVQMDTVVAYGDECGAVSSVGSNIDRKRVCVS